MPDVCGSGIYVCNIAFLRPTSEVVGYVESESEFLVKTEGSM